MGSSQDFLRHLHEVPAVLFLGQRHLALETGVDPVLSEILRKYGGQPATALSSYTDIFETTISQDPPTSLAWIDERCRRTSPSAGISNIAMLMWSAVYSSAIDSVWYSCLRTCRASQRTIQPVFDEAYRPLNPRNRFNLHCTFLFGSTSHTNEPERPPLTRFELIERKLVATSLARRMPEAVTPQGILVIEGYRPDDWLAPEDLYAILNRLNPGQTHVFSADDCVANHPMFVQLSRTGKVTLHRESLGEALLHAENDGLLPPLPINGIDESGHHLRVGNAVLAVPHSTWSRVSRSAIVLDDNAMASPPPLSDDARYREFRQFLAGADGVPRWSGFERRFAFERLFERLLRERTREKLSARDLSDQPLILHGQTGTGKTVALERQPLRLP